MIVKTILGFSYAFCTKSELPKIILNIQKYAMVFIITSLDDMADIIQEVRQNGVQESLLNKFVVLRKKVPNRSSIKSILSEAVSEIETNLKKRAYSHAPLVSYLFPISLDHSDDISMYPSGSCCLPDASDTSEILSVL